MSENNLKIAESLKLKTFFSSISNSGKEFSSKRSKIGLISSLNILKCTFLPRLPTIYGNLTLLFRINHSTVKFCRQHFL